MTGLRREIEIQENHDIEKRTMLSEKELLDERAEVLSRPLPIEALASEFIEVLTFSIGEERLAIETKYVTEVIRDVAITPLPDNTSPVIGVTNLRGEVLAVVSLWSILSARESEESAESGRWVVVAGRDRPAFGIIVSDLNEVASFPYECILNPSRTSRLPHIGLVRGVTADARMIIDGAALLQDPRFIIEDD